MKRTSLTAAVAVAVALLALTSCGSGDESDPEAVDTTVEAEPTTDPPTTVEPSSTTTRPQTTTTAPPTIDDFKATVAQTFPGAASQLEDAFRDQRDVEAVRSIVYDQAANVVRADILSEYYVIDPSDPDDFGRGLIDDHAWDIVSQFGSLWSSAFNQYPADFWPSMELRLEELTYTCPPDLMERFGARSAGQQDFEAGCTQP